MDDYLCQTKHDIEDILPHKQMGALPHPSKAKDAFCVCECGVLWGGEPGGRSKLLRHKKEEMKVHVSIYTLDMTRHVNLHNFGNEQGQRFTTKGPFYGNYLTFTITVITLIMYN